MLRVLLVASALVLVALPAAAFERTTTCASICNNACPTSGDGVCNDGGSDAVDDTCDYGTDCLDCGYRAADSNTGFRCNPGEVPIPIRWPSRCAGFHVNEAGSVEMPDFIRLVETIEASFETWNEVDCSYFEMVYSGETDENRPGYSTCAANTNFVGFVEEGWNELGYPSQALALTSVTFDIRSGTIVDADIEMNSANFTFARVDEADAVGALQDFQNTLTHEVGHFVGLDHASPTTHVGDGSWTATTMAESSPPGELDKRTLEEDDIAGICAIYPIEAVDSADPCEITNEGYFAAPESGPGETCPDAPVDSGKSGGCCAVGGGNAPGAASLGLVALALLLRRRR